MSEEKRMILMSSIDDLARKIKVLTYGMQDRVGRLPDIADLKVVITRWLNEQEAECRKNS